MLTGAAPASWVTSTTTRAPTVCAAQATAGTSILVPVEYWTALTHTTPVRSFTAAMSSSVRSLPGSSMTQRMTGVVARLRPLAASHGYVTLGKSVVTSTTSGAF